jgi:hypothetical protein
LYCCGPIGGSSVNVDPEEVAIVNGFSSNGLKINDGDKNVAV